MKASRAPGAVQSTYVQLHQQRQRENQTGISNKNKNDPKRKTKDPTNGGNGGIVNQFKSLDDIPDYPMDDNIQWKDNHSVPSYSQPTYSQHKNEYWDEADFE